MEDRYLFRAKRVDNGEWVEGYLIYAKKDCYVCENPYECMSEYSSLNGQSYGFGGFKLVDPFTICQCTGLKDKNGKLIWENDIVDATDVNCVCVNGIVVKVTDYNLMLNLYYSDELERVGNKFDNPELLESEG
jgi:uncharacterized phage protein (TIGR01671 family)